MLTGGDVKLELVNGVGTLSIAEITEGFFDLEHDSGLSTAINILLFTDAKADSSQVVGNKDLRGCWQDSLWGFSLGSLFWTLSRSVLNQETLLKFKDYAILALKPLLIWGVAKSLDVTVTKLDNYSVGISVTVYRPDGNYQTFRYSYAWNNLPASGS